MRLVNYCPSLNYYRISQPILNGSHLLFASIFYAAFEISSGTIPNNNPKFVTEQSPAVKLSVAVVECLPNGFEFMSYVRKIGSPSLTMP